MTFSASLTETVSGFSHRMCFPASAARIAHYRTLAEIARVLAPGGRILITSTFGPATPYYTPHKVLTRHFRKRGFRDLRAEQSPPGDWFLATAP